MTRGRTAALVAAFAFAAAPTATAGIWHGPAALLGGAATEVSTNWAGYAVAPGPKRWSVHAYGEAIDVNPVENPYISGGKVRPPAGRRYLDRANVRRGMAVPGGLLVRTFAAVGWQWGGRWASSPDYQHFSATGG